MATRITRLMEAYELHERHKLDRFYDKISRLE